MAYTVSRKINWRSFGLGAGALALGLCLPGISGALSGVIESVRNMLPFNK